MRLRALKKGNFANRVHVARDGAEALEFMFCGGALAGRRLVDGPKVILLDLKLPKINGLEVLKRVRGAVRTKMIPVVMLTSSEKQSDVVESYSLGVNSYLVIPVNFDGFVEAVRNLSLYWLLFNHPPKMEA